MSMDVTRTMGMAWDRMKRVLMQPFNLGTWFSFGLIFFVQSLVDGNANFSYRLPSSRTSTGGVAGLDLKQILDDARTWLSSNLTMVITIGVTVAVVGTALGLVLLWLGTRGEMMAIRCVMTGRATIGEHWDQTREAGLRLFKVHVILSVISLVVFGPLLGLAVYRFASLVDAGVTDPGDLIVGLVPFGVVGGVLGFVFAVVQGLLRNFVAPVMLRSGLPASAAWTRFRQAARGSGGSIALFFLIRIALNIAAGLLGTLAALCTCCLGALPVVQQTIMAPWYFLERAYGLYAIESLGPEMKMLDDLPSTYFTPPPPPGGFAPPGPPAPYAPWQPK